MPNLGPTELIIILVIVLLVFGAGKLATLGGALGKGVRDFRKSLAEEEEESEAEPQPAPKATRVEESDAGQDASA